MALPVTISDIAWPGDGLAYYGPFISSAGNVYVVGRDGSTATDVAAYKATDPTTSFTQGAAWTPAAGNTVFSCTVSQNGDLLWVFVNEGTGGDCAYNSFDMASDTWGTGTILTRAGPDNGGIVGVQRANGDIISVENAPNVTVMGTTYGRIGARRNGGTLTDFGTIALTATTAQHETVGSAVQTGNNRVHVFWSLGNTAAAGAGTVKGRCVLSTDNLGGTAPATAAYTVTTNAWATASIGTSQIVTGQAGVSSGNQLAVPYQRNSTNLVYVATASDAATPTWTETQVSAAAVLSGTIGPAGYTRIGGAPYNGTNKTVCWIDSSSSDPYYDKDTGGGFGTDTAIAATTAQVISANVFTRGSSIVLAMVYGTTAGTSMTYNEVVLGSAGNVIAVGQAVSTQTVPGAITIKKAKSVGQPAAVQAAQIVTRSKRRSLGQPASANTAGTTTFVGSHNITVNQAVSSNTVPGTITSKKMKAVGQPAAPQTAQAITRNKIKLLGQPSSPQTAQLIARLKRMALGQPSITATAQPINRLKRKTLGQATITMSSQTITVSFTLVPPLIDNFNRANASDPGANWAPQTGITLDRAPIVSNKIKYVGGTNGIREQWVGPGTFGADVEISYIDTSSQPTAGSDHWLAARWDATDDTWYGFHVDQQAGSWMIAKFVSGVFTSLATGAYTFSSGQVLKFKVQGTTLSAYQDGTLLGSTTDSDIVSNENRFGFLGFNAGGTDYIELDNFTARHVGAITVSVGRVTESNGALAITVNRLTGAVNQAKEWDYPPDYLFDTNGEPLLDGSGNPLYEEVVIFSPLKRRTLGQATETNTAGHIPSPAIVVVVNLATSANTAQTIARLKKKLLGQPSSANTALTVTRLEKKLLGQPTETNAGQPIARLKNRLLGQPLTTEASQPISRLKKRLLGQPLTVETALAIARLKKRVLGQPFETDAAQQIAKKIAKPVLQAAETDTAQTIVRKKLKGILQATSTHTALAMAHVRTRILGQPFTTEIAQAIIHLKKKLLGQASITNTALLISAANAGQVNQALESDTAQALARLKRRTIGQPTDTSIASTLARIHLRLVGQPLEIDTSGAVVHTKRFTVGQPASTNAAQPVTHLKRRLLAQPAETDQAQFISTALASQLSQAIEIDAAMAIARLKQKAMGLASETDIAQLFNHPKMRLVSQATELDAVQTIIRKKMRALGLFAETDLAQPLTHQKLRLVGRAAEFDIAQIINRIGSSVINQTEEIDESLHISRSRTLVLSQPQEVGSQFAFTHAKVWHLGLAEEFDTALVLGVFGGALVIGETGVWLLNNGRITFHYIAPVEMAIIGSPWVRVERLDPSA